MTMMYSSSVLANTLNPSPTRLRSVGHAGHMPPYKNLEHFRQHPNFRRFLGYPTDII